MVALVEYAGYFQKTLQRALAAAQPLDVRNLLVGFQRKSKTVRNAFRPVQQQIFGWHAIETVIDLHRRKLRAVKAQHLLVRQLFGIEIPFPLLVRVSRCAHAKLAICGNEAPPRQSI